MSLKRHPLTKHGAAILASSVLASFAFLGAAVSPAQAAPEPQPNPSLADKCGLDIGVVLDLSNSLSDRDVDDSKTAAKAVTEGLAGTPSRVSVNTFATFGPDGTNDPIASTSVATSDSVGELNDRVDALRRVPQDAGGTNWDRGLGQLDGTSHDLVLFVTDGKPTAYGVPGSERGNTDRGTRTDQIDIDKAIESANALKSEGTKVVGLGVGSEINEDNIKLVSGQTAGDDYYVISDYSALTKQLREIATKSCRGTLNVTKLIDPGVGGHGETKKHPGEGWAISSPDAVDGAEKTTNADGTVSFKLKAPADGVQATEEQQEGYRLQQQTGANAVCTADGREVDTKNIADGFQLTETVGTDAIVTCQIINEQIPGALSWKKVDEDGKALAGAEFTLTGPNGKDFVVTDNGDLDADEAAGQFEVSDLAWGDYTIKETSAPEGYALSDETQTVTISGEKRVVTFSDIVNTKSTGADADPDGDASADPDAEASTDPNAESEASQESDADTATDPDADTAADPDADTATDPDADSAADPDADTASDPDADTAADPDSDTAADPDAKASTDPDADTAADPDGNVSTDPDAKASTDPAAEASADPDADTSTNPEGKASTDPAGEASTDPEGREDVSTNPAADSNASSASDGGTTSADGSASDSDANGHGNGNDHLPRTGAAGAVTFGLLGVLLIGGGIAAVLVSRRRKTTPM
ncbi:SpaA isopeptide-forming pilin-related protein [Brevibacterium sp. S111]|uniref:SpaA isopeptide-forming pilin-related protein n=1 Tax=Brevibacterium sp. S111 TaxID=2483795 RepID=UPI00143697C3|nr:SpaA isopeptide-forming pilin-related protein [Brevibacterium sp. S111]